MAAPKPIGLSELIDRIKTDLLSADDQDDGALQHPPLLNVDEVKLEIQVTVAREAKGGLNIHVVELGGTASQADVQTVTVTLTPFLSKEERLKRMSEELRDATYKQGTKVAGRVK